MMTIAIDEKRRHAGNLVSVLRSCGFATNKVSYEIAS